MAELPILVLQKIISFLSLKERLDCKLVSKHWKFAIETASGPLSLCIYRVDYPQGLKWCFTEGNVICEDIMLHHGAEDPSVFINFNSRIVLFENLRKLCLYSIGTTEFLKDLPLLKKLKVLMIPDYFYFQKSRPDHHRIEFESSSLEKLSFKYTSRYEPKYGEQIIDLIDFNTPQLSSLVFWDESYDTTNRVTVRSIRFRYPLKLKHFECIEFRSSMKGLKNLETLNCQTIVCSFNLVDFESLQRLELFPKEDDELDYIKEIIKKKEHLERQSLEIIVCGFKDHLISYRSGLQVERARFLLSEHFLDQVAKHPAKFIGCIPWKFTVFSDLFADERFKELPNVLFKKICNIASFHIVDPGEDLESNQVSNPESNSGPVKSERKRKRNCQNPSYILDLLFQCNPRSLINYDFKFSIEFYEKLASILSIKEIHLVEHSENLDFDQFLKLKHLKTCYFLTDKMPIDFISKVFRMRFVGIVTFNLQSVGFYFVRYPEYYEFSVTHGDGKSLILEFEKRFDCLKDLIEELERLKKTNKAYLKGRLI